MLPKDNATPGPVPIAELKPTLEAKFEGEPFEVLPPGGKYWLGFEE
ncbi:MAG: hypothetical protein HY664_05810 [Chloroflexi bacterium]|nr:hypothetical protein [Chloroflexota bacterium]